MEKTLYAYDIKHKLFFPLNTNNTRCDASPCYKAQCNLLLCARSHKERTKNLRSCLLGLGRERKLGNMNGWDIHTIKSHCLCYRGCNRPTPFINSSTSSENTKQQPTHRIFIPKGSMLQSFTLKLSYPQQPPVFEELKRVKRNITCWELLG